MYNKFGTRKWRDYFANYVTPRDWKKGARDIPFGIGAAALYVSHTNGNDKNDGESWKTALKTPQAAIDAASSWTVIFLKNGTYPAFNIDVNTIHIVGEERSGTIISSDSATPITITAENCKIECLTAYAARLNDQSINAQNTPSSKFTEIWNVELDGIAQTYGASLRSNNSSIHDCYVSNANLWRGISIYGDYCNAYRNHIKLTSASANAWGISTVSARNNRFFENTLDDCARGLNVCVNCYYNTYYHNNFIGNTIQAISEAPANGNHWFENFFDDHTNVDNGFGIANATYTFTGGSDPRPVICRHGWHGVSLKDSLALASVCTETRLAELDAANIPTDIADLITRTKGLNDIHDDLDTIHTIISENRLTVAMFQYNAAFGTATNPAAINDNQIESTSTEFNNINEYVEINFGAPRYIKEFRMYGSGNNTGDGRWKIQHWNGSTWVDNTTSIPIGTVTAWGSWINLTTPEVTHKIRFVCTTVDSAGLSETDEIEMRG